MTQEFNGRVDKVAAGDIVINNAGGRLLTKLERVPLNKLVGELEKYGSPKWLTWKELHKTFGVECADELRLDQYEAVEAVLVLMVEKAKLSEKLSGTSVERLEAQLTQTDTAMKQLAYQNDQLRAKVDELDRITKRQESANAALNAEAKNLRAVQADSQQKLILSNAEVSKLKRRATLLLLALFASVPVTGILMQTVLAKAPSPRCKSGADFYSLGTVQDAHNGTQLVCASNSQNVADWLVIPGNEIKPVAPVKKVVRKPRPKPVEDNETLDK